MKFKIHSCNGCISLDSKLIDFLWFKFFFLISSFICPNIINQNDIKISISVRYVWPHLTFCILKVTLHLNTDRKQHTNSVEFHYHIWQKKWHSARWKLRHWLNPHRSFWIVNGLGIYHLNSLKPKERYYIHISKTKILLVVQPTNAGKIFF